MHRRTCILCGGIFDGNPDMSFREAICERCYEEVKRERNEHTPLANGDIARHISPAEQLPE